MRGMRELPWSVFIVGGLALTGAGAATYFIMKEPGFKRGSKPVAEMDQKETADPHAGQRAPAEADAHHGGHADEGEELSLKLPKQHKSARHSGDEEPKAKLSMRNVFTPPREPGGVCSSVEFPGRGPSGTKLDVGQWDKFLASYHDLKTDLLAWLERHRGKIPQAEIDRLQTQIRRVRVQRPPSAEEPDLAWRGIGARSLDPEGEPVIRIGGGFLRLFAEQPKRARFELARLIAQGWAPCEIKRAGASDLWKGYLSCMGMPEADGCKPGGYSESGWAVSSAVAAEVSDPGCKLPAFEDPKAAACRSKLLVSEEGAKPAHHARDANAADDERMASR